MPRLTVTRGLSASAPSCWTTVGTGQTHWAGKYEPWMFSVLKLVLFLGRTRQIHAVMNFLKAERRLKSEWVMWDRQGAGQTERCGPPEIPLMLGQPVPPLPSLGVLGRPRKAAFEPSNTGFETPFKFSLLFSTPFNFLPGSRNSSAALNKYPLVFKVVQSIRDRGKEEPPVRTARPVGLVGARGIAPGSMVLIYSVPLQSEKPPFKTAPCQLPAWSACISSLLRTADLSKPGFSNRKPQG